MPPLLCIYGWLAYLFFFKVVCMFLESRLKSYGKRVGNTRYICQGLEHQPALARYQANCWTAPWHKYKSPLLAAHVPGSWLGLAICPASFWAGRQTGRHNWGQLSNEGCCDHSWCQQPVIQSTFPPSFSLSTTNKGCRYLPYIQILVVCSVTKLFFILF